MTPDRLRVVSCTELQPETGRKKLLDRHYGHLKRDTERIEKEFLGEPVLALGACLVPALSEAILGEVPVLRGIADAINRLAGTLDKAIGDELSKDQAQIDALNKQIADLKSAAEASMNATFRIGIVISLIFIAISVYMTIQGFVSWALTGTFTACPR